MSASALHAACGRVDWPTVVPLFQSNQAGLALDNLLDGIKPPLAAVSGVIVLISIFILAWPERRQRLDVPGAEAGQ
jgi:hypothetical protein